MHLHEYQSKSLMREFGIKNLLQGFVIKKDSEIELILSQAFSMSPVIVIKAQVHAGGRGKAGGVKVCESFDEAVQYSKSLIGTRLVTKQTDSEGQIVSALYCELGCNIFKEFYLSILVDRSNKCVSIVTSTEGGMDIEAVAERDPEKIHTTKVDVMTGYMPFHTRKILLFFNLEFSKYFERLHDILSQLYGFFIKKDLSLLEVNPLVLTRVIKKDLSLLEVNPLVLTREREDDFGEFIILDAKIELDENSAFRQKELFELRDRTQEEELECKAKDNNLSYVKLGGSIGCMVNGAGLAMATMDIIQFYGEKPSNFLDVGGGASAEGVKVALGIILEDSGVKAVLINIFGGIVKCDMIATSIVEASRSLIAEGKKMLPMVVRLSGTNSELGLKIITESALNIVTALDLDDAAKKAVESVKT